MNLRVALFGSLIAIAWMLEPLDSQAQQPLPPPPTPIPDDPTDDDSSGEDVTPIDPSTGLPVPPASTGDDRLDAKGVGIAGGIIAGGELVIAIEALIGVDELWPYLTFPLLGAAGGGVGGYFLEQASPEGAVALLVGSIALLIPTAIFAASARAYDPKEAGIISYDSPEDAALSFETKPAPKEDGTVTEVETRPEGAPEGPILPPEAETDPVSPQGPTPQPPPPAETTGEDAEPTETSRRTRDQRRKLARQGRIKRATQGSLFYVDRAGSGGLSVPLLDVRSAGAWPSTRPGTPRRGVAFYLPLLRIDLP